MRVAVQTDIWNTTERSSINITNKTRNKQFTKHRLHERLLANPSQMAATFKVNPLQMAAAIEAFLTNTFNTSRDT